MNNSRNNYGALDLVENDLGIMNVAPLGYIQPPQHFSLQEAEPKPLETNLPPQIPYEKMSTNFIEKKPKRRRNEHRPERKEELLKDIAQEIYVRWKVKKMREKYDKDSKDKMHKGEQMLPFNEDACEKKAIKRWKKETAETTKLFFRAALIENVMLGEEDFVPVTKRKKKETKIKEDCHPYLLFCKENRENIQQKVGSKDSLTVLSNMWKNLAPTEKTKYLDKAKANKMNQQSQQMGVVQSMEPVGRMTMDGPSEHQQMNPVYYSSDSYLFKHQ